MEKTNDLTFILGDRDGKGRFLPGAVNTGRPKGALTATGKQVRQILTNVVSDHLPQIYEDLAALSPKDRVAALVAIAQLVLPRISAVAVGSADSDGEVKKQVFIIGGNQIEF